METDLISRSAALAMMDKYIDMAKDDEMHHAMCVVAEGVNDLPAVDAVPVVHAEWERDNEHHTFCTRCKARMPYVSSFEGGQEWFSEIEETPWCMHCGARMDGEADD